ncbi:MAG: FUSC family protein [Lewinella sp.]
MHQEELSALSDQALLDLAKKAKSASIMSAFLIGLMIGVVIFSIVTKSVSFLTLFPLYLAFRVFHNPENNKRNEALKKLLVERNLK